MGQSEPTEGFCISQQRAFVQQAARDTKRRNTAALVPKVVFIVRTVAVDFACESLAGKALSHGGSGLTSSGRMGRLRRMRSWYRCICGLLLLASLPAFAREYRFDGSISEPVLRSYLSRSMTTLDLLTGHGDVDDNIRMLRDCGVKFAGRTIYLWGQEADLPRKLGLAKKNAAKVHDADPEIILQACVFEIVSQDVGNLPVPDWAFVALGQPVEKRNFRYEAMLYTSRKGRDQWSQGASVPDVSLNETKLWFYY